MAQVKVQLDDKYTQLNVMKSQKASSEQKLNNLLGKSRQKQLKPDEAQKLQRGLEHEVKCFGKAINELNLQIHDLQKQEQELKP